MNTRTRFYRVVAAASLGAVLWAACSSPESRVAATSRANSAPPVTSPGAFEKRDTVTEVLKAQRELARTSERESIGVGSAEFDVRSYRNELVQKACLLLHQD